MKYVGTMLLGLAMTVSTAQAADTPDPAREQAFQDHIAYVATFAMPVLIEKCAATDAGYLQRAAPAYFRYVNTHQDQIERGRLLTLAEFAPGDTLVAYRERTLAQRLGRLDSGTPEQKQQMCEGALAMLGGMKIPGEWPPRD
ncbi:hypothetical protein ASD77_13895 [Pseudoxanthomonas sp. Root65]|jgi:hypothetical protein|uniref:hypothetical protein n=1 Tax=Pseudoxanthomonas sp. Root65 TaxID=1736576 RepID=UPI0006FEBF8B|nr:hypothetical protein [Pseudoxanthomonas sp. Root65]KRA52711.1 hypothetical protein ASD77_13895 [Pseudoxanthomonas sp. Root65]